MIVGKNLTTLVRLIQLSRNQRQSQPANAGLTLIEVLVAIIVVTIAITAITPPIVLSVGSRINSRRIEQATQLAQGEVERVRLKMMATALPNWYELPPVANVQRSQVPGLAPPASGCGTAVNDNPPAPVAPLPPNPPLLVTTPPICNATQVFRSGDFWVQTFRDPGISIGTGTNTELVAFTMGVRVYHSSAFDNTGAPLQALENPPLLASAGVTEGGQRLRRPLAVMYTEMARSTADQSLDRIRNYLQANP